MPRLKPEIAASLQQVERWMVRREDGSHELPPKQLDALSGLLDQYLPTPELAAFVNGLVVIAERLLQASESDPAADAILVLLERPQVLEPLGRLVEAVKHYRLHHTTIMPEWDAQMRGNMFRALLNAGWDSDALLPTSSVEPSPDDGMRAGRTRSRVKVFLSHSSADKSLARRLARDLQAANAEVWLDQWQIGVGEAFEQRIQQGLDETDFVLVLLTQASIASEWVDQEWRDKIEHEARTRRVAILPVRAETCEIPDFLAQRSHADISGGSYLPGFRHLLDLLRHHGDAPTLQRSDEAVAAEAQRRMAHLLEVERRALGLPAPASELQRMLPIVVPIGLEIGQDLIPLFSPDGLGHSRVLDELIPAMRCALQAQFGFPFPGIRILGNETDMPASTALILIDEIPELMVTMGPQDVLVLAPVERLVALRIAAQVWPDPQSGGQWSGIALADRDAAVAAGLACMDAAEYIVNVLQRVVQRQAVCFLNIDVVCCLVAELAPTDTELVASTVPSRLSWVDLTAVLRGLVEEDVGIGDLRAILGALAQSEPTQHSVAAWVEQARHALRAQITASFIPGGGALRVLRLKPHGEQQLSGALQYTDTGSRWALSPTLTQDLLGNIREAMNRMGPSAPGVVMVVEDTMLRPYLRRLVRVEFPALHVLSTQDLQTGTPVQVVADLMLPDGGGVTP